MITVNGKKVEVNHFPDGTQCLMNFPISSLNTDVYPIDIAWRYENDSELVTLMYIVKHIRNTFRDVKPINLYMPYVPNARMDRTKSDKEIFTLKYFADIINGLHFNMVAVLDTHSNVTPALLNRVVLNNGNEYIAKAFETVKMEAELTGKNLYVFFPDNGAMKRYKDLDCLKYYDAIYGQKIRDWDTGKIVSLEIKDENGENAAELVKDSIIFMVDDIISYGGTFYYAANKLHEYGAYNIYAYATHVEADSLWDEEKGTFKKLLNKSFTINGDNEVYDCETSVEKDLERPPIVSCLFTTDSLYNRKSGNGVMVLKLGDKFEFDD